MSADLDMDKRDNLIVHIEGLQATITKRNARIAELEAMLTGEGADERQQRALKREYKRGWQGASNQLQNTALDAARALGTVNKEAFRVFLEGDHIE